MATLTKAQLEARIAELEQQLEFMNSRCAHVHASAQRVIANIRAEANKPQAPKVAPKRTCSLKAVKSFATKEDMLSWAGANIGKFVVTTLNDGTLVANMREWH